MSSVALFHGWGFDANFWGKLQFGENWTTFVFNRGYFGDQKKFEELRAVDMIIAHSWGLHWIPEHLLKSAKYVIAINSFSQFIPEHQLESVKARRTLKKMIDGFSQNPHAVLELFYTNAFDQEEHGQEIPDFLHKTLLLHDLEQMLQNKPDFSNLPEDQKWLIIHSKKDKIMSQAVLEDWKKCGIDARIRIIEDGNHVLWRSHAKACLESIKKRLIQ